MVKIPLAIPQFGQTNVIHQEVIFAVIDNINEQVILQPEVTHELSGVNREESLLESQELESTKVSIDNFSKKEGMSSDNCNVYARKMRSGNLQSQDVEKTEVEKNENGNVTISNSDTFKKVQLDFNDIERAGELAETDNGDYYIVIY